MSRIHGRIVVLLTGIGLAACDLSQDDLLNSVGATLGESMPEADSFTSGVDTEGSTASAGIGQHSAELDGIRTLLGHMDRPRAIYCQIRGAIRNSATRVTKATITENLITGSTLPVLRCERRFVAAENVGCRLRGGSAATFSVRIDIAAFDAEGTAMESPYVIENIRNLYVVAQL